MPRLYFDVLLAILTGAMLGVAHQTASAAEPEAQADFASLFNGADLAGWDGDPRFWRVENGEMIGQTTQDNPAKQNTFLIYRDGEFGDFELRFLYQVEGYNSGVQYRSVDDGDWVVSGYQADFEDRWHKSESGPIDRFSGMLFDEKGRMFLAQRGEAVIARAHPEDPRKAKIEKLATVGDSAELETLIRRDDWNEYRVIAHGFQFTHIINGRVMALGVDEDESRRRASGIIAFQLHAGPPMQIRLKNIQIRKTSRPSSASR